MVVASVNTVQVSIQSHLIAATHLKFVSSVKYYPAETYVNRKVWSRLVEWGKSLDFVTINRPDCLLFAQIPQ